MADLPALVRLPQLLEARPYLTERWVRSLVANGTLPHYKLGKKLLFDLADVDAAVASSKVEAADEPRRRRYAR